MTNRLVIVGMTAMALSVSGLAVALVAQRTRAIDAKAGAEASNEPSATPRVRSGTEVVAVFLVSSTCGASRYPGLKDALDDIRKTLAADAARAGRRFVTIGVALDEEPRVGLDFLSRYGSFDEVLAGGSWLNTGAIEWLVRDLPGRLTLPQLVLLERDVRADPTTLTVSDDRVVARKVGGDAILEFAQMPDSIARR